MGNTACIKGNVQVSWKANLNFSTLNKLGRRYLIKLTIQGYSMIRARSMVQTLAIGIIDTEQLGIKINIIVMIP